MLLDDLFAEAERQMNICNACRYCEGYCPVWPALELRTTLTAGDLTHLANLCHDCQDCFTACMYTAPHEFDLNPPKIFAALREDTYRRYIWPHRAPGWLSGRRGVLVSFLAVAALLLALSVLTTGGAVFAGPGSGPHAGSAYQLIPHLLLLAVVTLPSLWSIGMLAAALIRYWRDTGGAGTAAPARERPPLGTLLRAVPRALVQSAQLSHMRGGDEGCAYPDAKPAGARRRFHLAVSYGFGLCLVSTTAAAAQQNLLHQFPPYPYLSVPVITGTVGGLGMVIGTIGLVVLKRRADADLTTSTMRAADYGLLWALLILAVTGLLTLVSRTSVLFGPVLVTHLAAVVVSFAIAPYTKFVHWLFRMAAIYRDNLERSPQPAAAPATPAPAAAPVAAP